MLTTLLAASLWGRAFSLQPSFGSAPQTACITSWILITLLGPAASARIETLGLGRNVVAALLTSALPHIAAHPSTTDWRASRFNALPGQDLSDLRAAARGRNVVLISLESTAAQYLRLYGGEYDLMPHLTSLASNAIVFDNAYAVYPESIKGLYSVLCSTFPSVDSQPAQYERLPCRSVAQVAADAGYRTALFHSGRFGYLGMESIVRNRGYQTLEDAGDIGGHHESSFGVEEPSTVTRMFSWIDALPRGQRFFLTYLPIAGHHPYDTPERGPFPEHDEIGRYRNALLYGDASLGALIDGLRSRGLEDNTLFVIYGDHGEAFGQHEGNYAHTFFVYEENVHVPFLIAAPGRIHGQTRVRNVVSLVDTAPTVLDLLGLPAPQRYQGQSMLDPAPRMALFFADYSLGILGLRDGPWKFIDRLDSRRAEIFNLGSDPQEHHDLSSTNADRAVWYQQIVRGWSGAQKDYLARAAK
jgi:arylsulfatase A-like enzyme